MPGYEDIRAGVREYWGRGTRVLVPGYEGIRAGVREYWGRGTRERGYKCQAVVNLRVIGDRFWVWILRMWVLLLERGSRHNFQ